MSTEKVDLITDLRMFHSDKYPLCLHGMCAHIPGFVQQDRFLQGTSDDVVTYDQRFRARFRFGANEMSMKLSCRLGPSQTIRHKTIVFHPCGRSYQNNKITKAIQRNHLCIAPSALRAVGEIDLRLGQPSTENYVFGGIINLG